MSEPELRPPEPTEIQTFNRLVMPYAFGEEQPAATRLALERLLPEERVLQLNRTDIVFPTDGNLYNMLGRGDFGPLAEHAKIAALLLNPGGRLTLPQLFATHLLSSADILSNHNMHGDIGESRDRLTYYTTQLAGRLALTASDAILTEGADPYLFSQSVKPRAKRVGNAMGGHEDWATAKLSVFADKLLLYKHVRSLIESEAVVQTEDEATLRAYNDDLFVELQGLQRQSIRSATHQEKPSMLWTFDDMSDLLMQFIEGSASRDNTIRPDRWRPAMLFGAIENNRELAVVQEMNNEQRPMYERFGRYAYLSEHGDVFADVNGTISLKELYEAAGKSANYERLRQFMVCKYFDLSVPPSVVEEAQEITRHIYGADAARGRIVEMQQAIPNAMLPRIAILRRFKTPNELDARERPGDDDYPRDVSLPR